MPSFSEMFPTYARLFSRVGNFIVPPRSKTGRTAGSERFADQIPDEDPAAIPQIEESPVEHVPTESGQVVDVEASAVAGGTVRSGTGSISAQAEALVPVDTPSPPVLNAEETQVLQMYQTWVELDKGVARAHEDLQRILNSRGRAAVLRSQAQETLEEGEVLREEAQRIGDAAWRAFDRGFATNIRGFASRRAMVREIDQSRRTQAELQRNVHNNAWEEAERSREEATAQVLKALNALAMVADQVERELAEAANLPQLADSLKQAAQEEFRCAEAVKDELLLLGREALNQLGVTPTSDHEYAAGELVSEESEESRILDLESSLDRERALSDGGTGFELVPEPIVQDPIIQEPIVQEPSGMGFTPVPPQSIGTSETPISGSGESMRSDTRPPARELPPVIDADPAAAVSFEEPVVDEPPVVDARPEPPAAQPVIQTAPANPPENTPAPPAPASPAQDLIREMEAARAFVDSQQTRDIPVAGSPAPVIGQAEPSLGEPTTTPPATTPMTPPTTPPATTPTTPMVGDIIYPEAEAQESVQPPAASPSAAEQLISDMEAARSAAQPRPEMADAAQELIRDMQLFQPSPVEDPPAAVTPPPPAPAAPLVPEPVSQAEEPRVQQPISLSPAMPPPAAPSGKPAEESYSGKIFLMFPSTLSQDEMGLVWEVLEEVARGSQIMDSRLLSASEGIQFTVQLGPAGMVVQDLKNRLIGSEFEGIEADRLKVNWPRR